MLKSPTLRDPLCRSLLSALFSACATRSISPSSSPKFLGAPQVPLPCLLPLAIQPLLLLPPGLHVLWPLISPLRPIPSSCRVGLCVNTSAGIIRCWVCCSASTTVSGMQSMFNERGSLWILNLILPATNTALSSGSIHSRNGPVPLQPLRNYLAHSGRPGCAKLSAFQEVKKQNLRLVAFADYHGVNTPPMADVRLQRCHQTQGCKMMHTIGFCEVAQTAQRTTAARPWSFPSLSYLIFIFCLVLPWVSSKLTFPTSFQP